MKKLTAGLMCCVAAVVAMFFSSTRDARDLRAQAAATRASVTPTGATLPRQAASRTTVVMLGTGTPIPDPDRSGPAVAIVVDSVPYLFDAGAGVIRRAAAAFRDGEPGLRVPLIGRLFLTHLHSDHTMGVNDAIFTPWIQGRVAPMEIYGPPGTKRLVNGILDGNYEDIQQRLSVSAGPAPNGWKANVHEIAEGEIFSDARIKVRAFEVPHSTWKHSLGFRVTTPDRVIVLSGDDRANPAIARECNGCDLLIHEVYSDSGFTTQPPLRQIYHAQAHTSGTQLGAMATAARPGKLILYHQLFFGASEAQLLKEVRSTFSGTVISAKDLQKF